MRTTIDIEKLVRWAYRDELPKRIGAAGGAISPGFQFIDLGGRIDSNSGEPGLPAALGSDPHPDALLVEAEVGRLGSFSMEWPSCRAHLAPDCGAFLGDDEIVLAALFFDLTTLVACFGRMGARPSWEADPWRGRRMTGPNGKPMVNGIDRHQNYLPGAHCPLAIEPDPREVVADRAQYAAWYEALTMLAARLANQLSRWDVTRPAAPAAPWTENSPQPAIRPDLRKSAAFAPGGQGSAFRAA